MERVVHPKRKKITQAFLVLWEERPFRLKTSKDIQQHNRILAFEKKYRRELTAEFHYARGVWRRLTQKKYSTENPFEKSMLMEDCMEWAKEPGMQVSQILYQVQWSLDGKPLGDYQMGQVLQEGCCPLEEEKVIREKVKPYLEASTSHLKRQAAKVLCADMKSHQARYLYECDRLRGKQFTLFLDAKSGNHLPQERLKNFYRDEPTSILLKVEDALRAGDFENVFQQLTQKTTRKSFSGGEIFAERARRTTAVQTVVC